MQLPPAPALRHPLVRFLGSIRFGITLLALILLYASVGSGLAPLRGMVEMTEMQVFQHWLFLLLIGLFSLSLLTATLTRIRLSVVNLGVWLVHSGLLLLVGGAAWYFGQKVEGDVLLLTPRIEIFAAGNDRRPLAEIPAHPGETWKQNMPAFGGAVQLGVAEAPAQPGGTAVVEAQFGPGPAQRVSLPAGGELVPLGNNLRARYHTFAPQNNFYIQDRPALYYGPKGGTLHTAELAGLPLHRERYLPGGGVLRDRDGREVPSKRTQPAVSLGPLSISTAWFEHWRMPLALQTPELPFDVQVTGYLPYVGALQNTVAGDGSTLNPIAQFRLQAGSQSATHALAALDPRRSVLELNLPIEFRWLETPEALAATLQPLVGQDELTIEVLDPPVRQIVAIVPGQTLEIPGTPYTLTIESLLPDWPLVTPGFEGARSPVALVNVQTADKRYQRTVIERFPQFSQDIDAGGVRHRDGPYDPNLRLTYRTAGAGRVLLLAGPELPPQLVVLAADGTVRPSPLEPNRPQPLGLPGFNVDLTLLALHERGRWVEEPLIQPLEQRRPNMGRGPSAIRLALTGRGELAGWRDTRWCFFTEYPRNQELPADLAGRVLSVRVPDGREYEFVYSRASQPLGATLVPGRLKVKFFPGRRGAESWQSEFYVASAGTLLPGMVRTNETMAVAGWTLFQSGAARDHWSYTILGVGNRQGIWPMTLGCVLITVGCLYAFYVKPVLKRRAAAAVRSAAIATLPQAAALGAAPAVRSAPTVSAGETGLGVKR